MGIGILLLRNISTPEDLKVVVVNLLLPVKAQLWPDFVHVHFFVLWTMALSDNKQSHPLTKSLKLTWLFGNFPNLVQSVVHLHDCSARQPHLANTDVKILAEVWTLTVAVPPHVSTTEGRVSPTCPSSDCFHKLNSNNTDNERASVQRRTARLEERPIAFVLLSVPPMERANPAQRCGRILGEQFQLL